MGRGKGLLLLVALAALLAVPANVSAHGMQASGADSATAAMLTQQDDVFQNFTLKAASPFPAATSSDIAFWGDRAFVGNYNGFRIFDISGDKPELLQDVNCPGAQGDPSVWDRDKDGSADLLILSVDRTMANDQCGAPTTAHDDPNGWEGLRIFDVSNPAAVKQIATVYQDCGSHTNTIIPRRSENRLLVLNSSYPLRPGPTCGPQQDKRDELHGVVQVVEVPLGDPTQAKEVKELPVNYPGDEDNKYLPISEHGLNGGVVAPGLVDGMRACHDIGVHIEAGLVGAACGEQAQVWKLDKETGLPDTENPVWVYDQDNVDFWHSATFSWDGKVANFIDESFGDGCPTTTVKRVHSGQEEREYESGNMFFMGARSGELFNEFRIRRGTQDSTPGTPSNYCSSHLGNVIPSSDRYLLANAYYRAGSSVIDFTKPQKPSEVAYADRQGAGTWSTYWYESTSRTGSPVDVYANDGVHNAPQESNGFEAWAVTLGDLKRTGLPYLNPQTQEQIIKTRGSDPKGSGATALSSGRSMNLGRFSDGFAATRGAKANKDVLDHFATP